MASRTMQAYKLADGGGATESYRADAAAGLWMDSVLSPKTDARGGFDEQWRLRMNADVARAVEAGRLSSGYEHYLRHGKAEGRSAIPPDPALPAELDAHEGVGYLVPRQLTVLPNPLRRIALIGSCLVKDWEFHKNNPPGVRIDVFFTNNLGSIPERSADEKFQLMTSRS